MRINNNIAALNTFNQLSTNAVNSNSALQKLSSGLQINKAGDDAAGLAISEKMRSQIRGLDQAAKNSQDGISLIQTAEGALNEITSILQRMRELSVQAGSGTLATEDRAAITTEISQLKEEIDGIASRTQFNGANLIDGAFGVKLATGSTLQAGANGVTAIDISGAAAAATYTLTAGSAGQVVLSDGQGNQQTVALADNTAGVLNFDKLGVKITVNATWNIAELSSPTVMGYGTSNLVTESELVFSGDLADADGVGEIDTAGVTEPGTYTLTYDSGENELVLTGPTGFQKVATAEGTGDEFDFSDLGVKITLEQDWQAVNIEGKTIVATVKVDDTSVVKEGTNGVTEIELEAEAAGKTFALGRGAGENEVTLTIGGTTYTAILASGTAGTLDFDGSGVKITVNNSWSIDAWAPEQTETGDATIITTNQAAQSIQIGANAGQKLDISLSNMSMAGLGLVVDVSTSEAAGTSITSIDAAITKLSTERAKLGAYQNRLEHTINNLNTSSENLSAAESRIRDVDMAREMMEFTKTNILSQAATAMLAQANQQPQQVLRLLQ